MQVAWSFNANQYEPNQGLSAHPPAQKIPFQITGTSIQETKDKTGGMLVVELTSSMGTMVQRYNIHNQNAKAVEIAYGQLSALCRAVGVYNIDGQNEGAALRGARGLMDVGYQKGEEPSPDNPNAKGYTELKRVYDVNGNDPAKPGQAQQTQAPQGQQGGFGGQPQQGGQPPQGQPLQQQPGGSWGPTAGQPNPSQQQPQPQQNPNPNGGQAGQAWSPGGGTGGGTPPWGPR